jgi:hypothetical protein
MQSGCRWSGRRLTAWTSREGFRELRAVAQLQEGLGAFNDEASATHLLWDIEAAAGPQAAKAAGTVLGWCGRGTVIADDNLRKS